METHPEFSRNKTLYISQISFAFFMLTLIIEKVVLSQSKINLSYFPILDLITSLGFYFFGMIVLGIYAYYSWKYDAFRFYKWMELQDLFPPKWMNEWRKGISKEYTLWSSRIISTMGFIFSVFISYSFMQAIKNILFGV